MQGGKVLPHQSLRLQQSGDDFGLERGCCVRHLNEPHASLLPREGVHVSARPECSCLPTDKAGEGGGKALGDGWRQRDEGGMIRHLGGQDLLGHVDPADLCELAADPVVGHLPDRAKYARVGLLSRC